MKKTVLVLTIMAIMTFPAVVLIAQIPSPPSGLPARATGPAPCVVSVFRIFNPLMLDVLCSKLKLDDQQKAKVSDLLAKAEEAAKPKIEAQRQAAEKFVDALSKTDITEAQLLSAGESAMKADSELLAEKINTFLALRNILSEPQKAELAKFMGEYSRMWQPRSVAPASATK